jgi:hypothetical protein
MPKQDSPARTAITPMKMGKTSWTKVNWRRETRISVVPLAMVRNSDSIWNRFFTTSASDVIQKKRQAPAFVGNVMYENDGISAQVVERFIAF